MVHQCTKFHCYRTNHKQGIGTNTVYELLLPVVDYIFIVRGLSKRQKATTNVNFLWAYAPKYPFLLHTMHVNAVKKERRQVNKKILRIKKCGI